MLASPQNMKIEIAIERPVSMLRRRLRRRLLRMSHANFMIVASLDQLALGNNKCERDCRSREFPNDLYVIDVIK